MTQLHVGDTGTILRFTIYEEGIGALDVSGADVLKLKLEKKDKTVHEYDLAFYVDGKDGVVQYTTGSGDLDQKGKYTAQLYLEMDGGKWHTSEVEIEVLDILVVTT